MTEFNFAITSYKDILAKLAGEMKMPLVNDRMDLPPGLGTGYFRFVRLPNKMEALLMNLDLTDDFWFNRGRTELEHYVFVCEEIQNTGRVVIDIDGQQVVNEEPLIAGMHLFSFLSDLHQFAPRGSRVKGFRVVISPEWLASYLRIEKMEDVLQRYLQLKSASIHRKEMDQESLQMLREILDHEGEITVDELAFIQNRIMMVLEGFFSWMYEEMTRNPRLAKIGREDIEKVRGVESFLLQDLSKAPVVNELARHATMSATRLKMLFKQVYGLPPYEYFQQHRMLKAKQLLRETKMPIQEIGRSLGYSNMSNFTLAFRKVFNVNPSELRR
jgi:AraC-like DNA-binding protein